MSNKAKLYMLVGITLSMSLLLLTSCNLIKPSPSPSPTPSVPAIPTTLNDIAHNVDERLGFTVYIPENSDYVPYYVLTNNYNDDGNCLLLRKHLLDEKMIYIDNINRPYDNPPPSYYATSDIDKFLSDEFYKSLSSISDKIIDSEILITDIDSIGSAGKKNLTINRKVFLLSFSETSAPDSTVNDGVSIECLKPRQISGYGSVNEDAIALRTATTASGEAEAWWLRTPETWYSIMVYVVSYEGGSSASPVSQGQPNGSGSYEYANSKRGVRPAFCLSPDTAIYEDIVDGEKRYFLKLD